MRYFTLLVVLLCSGCQDYYQQRYKAKFNYCMQVYGDPFFCHEVAKLALPDNYLEVR